MTERVRFKSRDGRPGATWEVIKAGARSVDIQSVESGRILYSVDRTRLDVIPSTEQEQTP